MIGSTANGIVAGVIAPLVMHSTRALALTSLLMMSVGLFAWIFVHRRWPETGRAMPQRLEACWDRLAERLVRRGSGLSWPACTRRFLMSRGTKHLAAVAGLVAGLYGRFLTSRGTNTLPPPGLADGRRRSRVPKSPPRAAKPPDAALADAAVAARALVEAATGLRRSRRSRGLRPNTAAAPKPPLRGAPNLRSRE